ncbi:MAG: glycine C-acetyltransferase [candidate division KSB1 bacterium]|nr:glycine C-acetyltransferase [candidate division KSB1 bacterium]MDZ7275729.1 glycine C-acetyltransferase [candidate division KSB1 bacterium]MDZ7284580.1 glycine C-acetyltransferase [candidate division KSB1 bacterium]MDZ7298001.1 glycine C-acetyltransferase [candidate division KSB1 bacterium]MDZ7305831.1 glycine C-acetyltransferase [candidate division KSB1 bacterium]
MSKLAFLDEELQALRDQGQYIQIRTIESAMGAWIQVDGKRVLNLCANNYLGFANHPRLKEAAIKAIESYGVGPAAVRTIAGTQKLHLELEEKLAAFKGVEAAISFQSGFVSNQAVIPTLTGAGDVIFSDELNHASIIDGTRLSKAKVVRYNHNDVADLEAKIKNETAVRRRLIITDGVFSMDGDIAPLPDIVAIAEKYDALTMVDDAHGEGVLGSAGRGIADHFGLHGRVDIEIGTLSKAFGVVGGYAAGRKKIVDFLRQRARPFLFSSAVTPADVAACIAAVDILTASDELVAKLWSNTKYFKDKMVALGFNLGNSVTPITPVMIGDTTKAQALSRQLFEAGIFAMAITYPTVPKGRERLRLMMSATHSLEDLNFAVGAFEKAGRELGLIK